MTVEKGGTYRVGGWFSCWLRPVVKVESVGPKYVRYRVVSCEDGIGAAGSDHPETGVFRHPASMFHTFNWRRVDA